MEKIRKANEGEQNMRIEFGLSIQDLKQIQKHQKVLIRKAFSFTNSFWLKLLWALAGILWAVPTMFFVTNLPSRMGLLLLYIACIPVVVLILLMLLQKRKYYLLAEPSYRADEVRTVTITDNGLESTAGPSHSFTPWRDVREIVEVPEYTLFVLPLFACIAVPTRSFSDKNQLAAFVNEARIKISRAEISNEQEEHGF